MSGGASTQRRCDVLVVGAGPAGGELARELARQGVAVLLVDRLADQTQAAFSSAAVPLETLQRFGLPAAVVAARWQGWRLVGPAAQERIWSHPSPLGAVLDFGALRQWLAAEAVRWGAELQLGWRAIRCDQSASGVCTELVDADGRLQSVHSDWVVDASGERRVLLGAAPQRHDPLLCGLGVEWLLRLPADHWASWSNQLSFFLGSGWLSYGYGWVFPMQAGLVKLGVCRLEGAAPQRGSTLEPLGSALRRLQQHCGLGGMAVLDRHGGRIRSRVHRRDPHRLGRLLGLGDAVSTANLLGGEGIRHALTSARVLAPLLVQACHQADGRALDSYPSKLRRQLGWRWGLSGRLARRTWLGLHDARGDQRLDRLLNALEGVPAEQLSELLFDYRFERYGLRTLPYLLGLR